MKIKKNCAAYILVLFLGFSIGFPCGKIFAESEIETHIAEQTNYYLLLVEQDLRHYLSQSQISEKYLEEIIQYNSHLLAYINSVDYLDFKKSGEDVAYINLIYEFLNAFNHMLNTIIFCNSSQTVSVGRSLLNDIYQTFYMDLEKSTDPIYELYNNINTEHGLSLVETIKNY